MNKLLYCGLAGLISAWLTVSCTRPNLETKIAEHNPQPTITANFTPTPTATVTPYPTATLTPKPTYTPTMIPTLTPTHTPTPTPVPLCDQKTSVQTPTQKMSLQIPKIKVNAQILCTGVDKNGVMEAVDYAVGYYKYSAEPGQRGNSVMTAHNDIKGEIFRYLDRLENGDEIIVTVGNPGKEYVYRVRESKKVQPNDMSVIAPSDEAIITLISCWPYRIDNLRIIVAGELVKVI